MNEHSSLAAWLEHLRTLSPATGVLLVGAGAGASPWTRLLQAWKLPGATLVEADSEQFQSLKAQASNERGWEPVHALVGEETRDINYHLASNTSESGLLAPENLRCLWPNIKTRKTVPRRAISLADLVQGRTTLANWLIIDCLPALPLLRGAGVHLLEVEVIVARVVLDEKAVPGAGVDDQSVRDYLSTLGFRRLTHVTERNPGLGHALYVRDYPALLQDLRANLQSAQEKVRQADEELRRATSVFEARESQWLAERSSLEQATARSDALASAIGMKLEGLPGQLRELLDEAVTQRLAATDASLLAMREEIEAKLVPEMRLLQSRTRQVGAELKDSLASDVAKQMDHLRQALQPSSDEKWAKQTNVYREQLKEVEHRIRSDLNKGLKNSVKQVESFMGIQNYLTTGQQALNFHGWPISPDIGLFLIGKVRQRRYELIIEFGGGTSTLLLAKALEIEARQGLGADAEVVPARRIISFEHNLVYHEKTQQMLRDQKLDGWVDVVHAPLIDWADTSGQYLYYDCEKRLSDIAVTLQAQSERILVFVDGPPGATCANTRYPAVPHVFSKLGTKRIDVMLDDASRPEEKNVVELWRAFWEKRSIRVIDEVVDNEKGIYCATNDQSLT